MKLVIHIVAAIVLCASCKKTQVATASDKSILVYDQRILTIPLVKDECFYFVSEQDSKMYISTITAGGERSDIVALSGYLPEGFTFDSLESVKTLLLSDQSTAWLFCYNRVSATQNMAAYTLLSLGTLDKATWTTTDTIASILSQASSSQAIYENGANELAVVSSNVLVEEQKTSTTISETTYSASTGTIAASRDTTLQGITIVGIMPANTCAIIFANVTPGGSTRDVATSSSSNIMKINEAGITASQVITGVSITEVYATTASDDTYVISANSGNERDGYAPVVFQASFSRGKIWACTLSTSDVFITSVSVTSDGFYLSGAKYSGETFAWSNTTTLGNAQMFAAKIDPGGNPVWEESFETGASIGTSAIETSGGTLAWLASKKLFFSIDNTLLVKTTPTGTIK